MEGRRGGARQSHLCTRPLVSARRGRARDHAGSLWRGGPRFSDVRGSVKPPIGGRRLPRSSAPRATAKRRAQWLQNVRYAALTACCFTLGACRSRSHKGRRLGATPAHLPAGGAGARTGGGSSKRRDGSAGQQQCVPRGMVRGLAVRCGPVESNVDVDAAPSYRLWRCTETSSMSNSSVRSMSPVRLDSTKSSERSPCTQQQRGGSSSAPGREVRARDVMPPTV